MNFVWSGIMILIAMFCKVEGDFAHEEGKRRKGFTFQIVGIICVILALLCIVL